jgi:hypothetical protein
MEGKKSEDNAINQHLIENVLSRNSALLEKLRNLALGDCELVVYDAMCFQPYLKPGSVQIVTSALA